MAERKQNPGSPCGPAVRVGDAVGGCAGRAVEARGRSQVYGAQGRLPCLRGAVRRSAARARMAGVSFSRAGGARGAAGKDPGEDGTGTRGRRAAGHEADSAGPAAMPVSSGTEAVPAFMPPCGNSRTFWRGCITPCSRD